MIQYSNILQQYLVRIARGELPLNSDILPIIQSSNLYLRFSCEEDSSTHTTLKIPSVIKDNVSYVPLFLHPGQSLTLLEEQQTSEIKESKILGKTLFSSLSKGQGIVIEPSTSLEVFYTYQQIQECMKQSKHVEASSSFYLSGEIIPNEETLERKSQNTERKTNTNSIIDIVSVKHELENAITSYESIIEAYALEYSSEHSEMVLGLLVPEWIGDERFNFYQRISQISEKNFSYPSAIEVYDDLVEMHARSWDLFKMIPPFYVKETVDKSNHIENEYSLPTA